MTIRNVEAQSVRVGVLVVSPQSPRFLREGCLLYLYVNGKRVVSIARRHAELEAHGVYSALAAEVRNQ